MNPTSVSGTIVQEITIKGPAERIFEALTNPDERMKWWGGRREVPDHADGVRSAPRRQVGDARHRHGREALYRGRRVSQN